MMGYDAPSLFYHEPTTIIVPFRPRPLTRNTPHQYPALAPDHVLPPLALLLPHLHPPKMGQTLCGAREDDHSQDE